MWRWYELSSAYGQEIQVQSGGRGPNLAYYLPHLSGVQLLTSSQPSLPAGRSAVTYHTPSLPGAAGQVRVVAQLMHSLGTAVVTVCGGSQHTTMPCHMANCCGHCGFCVFGQHQHALLYHWHELDASAPLMPAKA